MSEDPEGRWGSAWYYEELPLDYVHQSELGSGEHYFAVTLEYGPNHDQHDPFDVGIGRIGQGDVDRTGESRYLHPVVRHYRRRVLAAEHHVTENLENEWTGAVHREPLKAFFERELAIAAPSATVDG